MPAERDFDDDDDREPVSAVPDSVRAPPMGMTESGPLTPRSTEPEATLVDLRPPSESNPAPKKPGDPDTLISAPRPAEREELESAERFRLLDDRIDELDARLRMLERRPKAEPSSSPLPWWIWLVFLVGLAVSWRLLASFWKR